MLSRKTLKQTRAEKFAQKVAPHKAQIANLDHYGKTEVRYIVNYLKTLEKLNEHLIKFEDCIADFEPHDSDRGKIGLYIDKLDGAVRAVQNRVSKRLIFLTAKSVL